MLLWLKNPSFRRRAYRFLFFYLFPFRAKDLFHEIAGSDNQAISATGRAFLAFSQYKELHGLPEAEALRSQLLKNKTRLSFPDYGAGSEKAHEPRTKTATVADLCAGTAKPRKWALLLHLLTKELKPEQCLELGTALGISSAYIGAGLRENNKGHLTTIEGAMPLADLAAQNIHRLGLDNIVTVKAGQFRDMLPKVLSDGKKFDLVFIDGHHQGEATLAYYEMIRPHLNTGAILIFDDIYYSKDMQQAWEKIKKERSFKLVADLGQFGICLYTNSGSFRPIEITC